MQHKNIKTLTRGRTNKQLNIKPKHINTQQAKCKEETKKEKENEVKQMRTKTKTMKTTEQLNIITLKANFKSTAIKTIKQI